MSQPKPEFEVERIVSDKYLVGKRFFFVQWKGFDSSENTWEPEENLANCPRLIKEYFCSKGLRNSKRLNVSSTLLRSISNVSKQRRSATNSILALASPKSSSSVDSKPVKRGADDSKMSAAQTHENSNTSGRRRTLRASSLFAADPSIASTTISVQLVKINSFASSSLQNSEFEAVNRAEKLRSSSVPIKSSPKTSPRSSVNLEEINDTLKSNVTRSINESNVRKCSTIPCPELTVSLPRVSPMMAVDVKPSRVVEDRDTLPDVEDSKSVSPERNDSKAQSSVFDETALHSTHVYSEDDPSWHHSTFVERKPGTKFTVRLFDRTPRPEVLSSVLCLDDVEDSDEEMLTRRFSEEDSDKENVSRRRRRGRPTKRKSNRNRSVKRLKSNDSNSKTGCSSKADVLSTTDDLQRSDLPESDDATVLLAEQSAKGGFNFVMYFAHLNLVKSIPEKMASKYYSEAVIGYYRRSAQPAGNSVRRRSL